MLAWLFLTLIGVSALNIARGGAGFNPFDVVCGSRLYWALTFTYIPFTVLIATIVGSQLVKETARKELIGYPFQEGDIHWSVRSTFIYSSLCSMAGVLAGMFGVGGGIVKAPLMNEMGVLPQSIQATAGFMIFFTAGTATISYELYGMLDKTYALPLSLIGFVFNQIGQVIVFHFVER